jgi:sporulation protein YlmC with PRC-barrel domain
LRAAAVALALLAPACESAGERDVASAPPVARSETAAPRTLAAMRAGDLVGRGVYNRAGERVGTVDDVVVNRRDRTLAAVIEMGGFLGIGARQAVVPVRQLRLEGERVVGPNLTRATLEGVDNYRWREWDAVEPGRVLGAPGR